MKRKKRILGSPIVTVLAFIAAAGLLLFSSIGGARAALTYYSENYTSQVQMFDIGVTLEENGKDVSWRNYRSRGDGSWNETSGELSKNMLAAGEKLLVNKPYKEELSVRNSGTINQYVRVSIYKYWADENGTKQRALDPDRIKLHYVNQDSAWLLDKGDSTSERAVFYYNKLLNAGDETPLLSDTLTIDGSVAFIASQKTEGDTVTATYDYDGRKFCVEAKVDAVQEDNAEDAILSAWGKNVSISGTSLSLN